MEVSSGVSSAGASTPFNPVRSYLLAKTAPTYSRMEGVSVGDDGTGASRPLQNSKRLLPVLLAEFIGMAIFQIYGGSANDEVAAFGNGLTLAVVVYATAHVSGGHVNPAVTFANCLTGHMSWARGGLYMLAQLLGGIFGALLESGLLPNVAVGGGAGMPGCFTHLKGIQTSTTQLWWWETIMTFFLVTVVYATAVTKPGHGNIGPLAIGFTLFASACIGGPSTGAALNPARVLGPAMVFHCYWSTAFVYVFAEFFGALIAAALVVPLYGVGQLGPEQAYAWLGISMPRHAVQLPQHVQDVPASQPGVQPHQAYALSEGRSKSAGPLIPSSVSAAHSAPLVPPKQQASKGGDGAAPFPVSFSAPVPPPKPPKPSLAAFAQAEKARPQQGPSRGN